jgi:hypothetical protein
MKTWVLLIGVGNRYRNLSLAEGPRYLEGKVSGAVFSDEPDDQREMLKEVFGMYAWSNPLWPKVFPGCRKMEAEVIRMCCDLFRGGPNACGTVIIFLLHFHHHFYDFAISDVHRRKYVDFACVSCLP